MYSLGIDSGSTMIKGVLFDGKDIIAYKKIPTSANPKESIQNLYKELYSDKVAYVVATGYGRLLLPEADRYVTEITCHGTGAAYLSQEIGAVIDIGGQDCKAILLDENQHVIDFLMNDKCAAGTGRFIEMMMRILEEPMSYLDNFVKGKNPISISSMCAVFAEGEIVSLLAKGADKGDIALGIIHSICRRTAFFAERLKLADPVFFSGGLAGFQVFRDTLEFYLKRAVKTNTMAQYAGAIGAALIGYKKAAVK